VNAAKGCVATEHSTPGAGTAAVGRAHLEQTAAVPRGWEGRPACTHLQVTHGLAPQQAAAPTFLPTAVLPRRLPRMVSAGGSRLSQPPLPVVLSVKAKLKTGLLIQ